MYLIDKRWSFVPISTWGKALAAEVLLVACISLVSATVRPPNPVHSINQICPTSYKTHKPMTAQGVHLRLLLRHLLDHPLPLPCPRARQGAAPDGDLQVPSIQPRNPCQFGAVHRLPLLVRIRTYHDSIIEILNPQSPSDHPIERNEPPHTHILPSIYSGIRVRPVPGMLLLVPCDLQPLWDAGILGGLFKGWGNRLRALWSHCCCGRWSRQEEEEEEEPGPRALPVLRNRRSVAMSSGNAKAKSTVSMCIHIRLVNQTHHFASTYLSIYLHSALPRQLPARVVPERPPWRGDRKQSHTQPGVPLCDDFQQRAGQGR